MILALYFLFYIAFIIFVAWLGRERKFGFWGYLFASILLTPYIGLLLILAADSPAPPPPPRKVGPVHIEAEAVTVES